MRKMRCSALSAPTEALDAPRWGAASWILGVVLEQLPKMIGSGLLECAKRLPIVSKFRGWGHRIGELRQQIGCAASELRLRACQIGCAPAAPQIVRF